MPDLLGATNPVPGYDSSTANRNIPVSPDNTQIQNIPDPSRVVRGDRRSEQQDSSSGDAGRIRYDSNFQTFLQRLKDSSSLTSELTRIFRRGVVVSSGLSEGIAEEISQAMEMLKMSEQELLRFLMGQFKAGTRFGGALFALLRGAYARAGSEGVQTDILQFLKSYSDFSSTGHIEGNLLRRLEGMADAMPSSWGDKLRELLAQLQNGIAAGDRQGNLALIQQKVFPLMSAYVEQTHDMGTPRALLTLLALDVARYENGSESNLLELFHRLASYGTLKNQLGGIDDQALLQLLRNSQVNQASMANRFADHLAAAAARALRGEGSAETQEVFRQVVSAMLINESVYMPVNHYLIPMEMNERMLFSELWVDPDAEEKGQGGQTEKAAKFLFKMDIQSLGLFDVVLTSRGQEVGIRVSCPEKVAPFSGEIEENISKILVRNGLTPAQVSVRKMDRPVALTEVFPKIFEGKNSVNVKV